MNVKKVDINVPMEPNYARFNVVGVANMKVNIITYDDNEKLT